MGSQNLVALRKTSTETLTLLFSEAAAAVDKLAKGVNLLKDEHPALVSLFEKTRNIKDLGS